MKLNNENKNREPSDDDLDWLAFCYIADELDVQQRAAFEQRLATDVLACEAVANAVQLSSLVYEVADSDFEGLVELPTDLTERSQPAKWSPFPTLVFAASVVLCLIAGGWIWTNSSGSQQTLTQNGLDVNQLATTWAEGLVDDEDPGNDFESVILTTGTESGFGGELDGADINDGWLLVALADMEGDQ